MHSVVGARGLSCCAVCAILFSQPEIELLSPALQGRFLTTGPPRKSPKARTFIISYYHSRVSFSSVQFSRSVSSYSLTPWTAARQASLSITNSQSLLKCMSIESVMPSNHLILCRPLLLLPSIFPSIRVFSNESVLLISWPKHWSFSFSMSHPMNIQDWFPLGLTGLISWQSKGLSRVFSNITVQKRQFFGAQLSLWSNSHTHTWPLEKP